MKRALLSIFISLLFVSVSNAQVGDVEYQSIFSNQGSTTTYQNRSSSQGGYYVPQRSQVQTTRTNAYYIDSYSNKRIKLPIKVAISNNNGYAQIYVVEKYVSYGMGGSWQKTTKTYASQCNSMLGGNPLESQFMYKIMIDGRWCYFDL